jgi:hypothetical protein
MRMATLIVMLGLQAVAGLAQRFPQNPIVTPASSVTLGDNLNGPSLIRVPAWIDKPLGRYYLYFAHHNGTFIRLAYADALAGPWRIHEPGTLRLDQAPACNDHVASPDVHVDDARREILMYFHCPSPGPEQKTFLATSSNGLEFRTTSTAFGPPYFRVFRWGDSYYTIVRAGGLLRSRDMRTPFEPGPTLIPPVNGRLLRHAAVDLRADMLHVYYSRIGDSPERILRSDVRLTPDWSSWRASPPVDVLAPEREYEGSTLPLDVSVPDAAPGRVRQLRDPGIFSENGKTYLLYSIAGESGLAISELGR